MASNGRTDRRTHPTDKAPRSSITSQRGASPTIFPDRDGIHDGASGAPAAAAGLRRFSRTACRIPRSRSKSVNRWALVARSSAIRASGVQELSIPVTTMAERGGWAEEGKECQVPRGTPKSHTKSELRDSWRTDHASGQNCKTYSPRRVRRASSITLPRGILARFLNFLREKVSAAWTKAWIRVGALRAS